MRRLTLIAVLGLPLLAPAGACASQGRVRSFGSFAGYVWFGHVSSVHASWRVPRLRRGSPAGVGGTWIGAQGAAASRAFVQIGTVESGRWPKRRHRAVNRDAAFWSDTAHGYHAQLAFRVRPGDRISATIKLAAGRWTLSIRDLRSGAKLHLSTPQEASASFAQAEWVQEDPRSAMDRAPVAYPRLGRVRFTGLEVDARRPPYSALYSRWMSLRRVALAPSPLREGSFSIEAARPISHAGARYLKIAATDDAATESFQEEMSGWHGATPSAHLAAERARFAAAVHRSIRALSDATWPASVARRVTRLIRASRVLMAQTAAAPRMTASGLSLWKARWAKDGAALGRAAHRVRRALGIPELTPESKSARRALGSGG